MIYHWCNIGWVWSHHLFHILQAIKTWSWGRSRNEAVRIGTLVLLQDHVGEIILMVRLRLASPPDPHTWIRLDCNIPCHKSATQLNWVSNHKLMAHKASPIAIAKLNTRAILQIKAHYSWIHEENTAAKHCLVHLLFHFYFPFWYAQCKLPMSIR